MFELGQWRQAISIKSATLGLVLGYVMLFSWYRFSFIPILINIVYFWWVPLLAIFLLSLMKIFRPNSGLLVLSSALAFAPMLGVVAWVSALIPLKLVSFNLAESFGIKDVMSIYALIVINNIVPYGMIVAAILLNRLRTIA
jgi:hypothetical protein